MECIYNRDCEDRMINTLVPSTTNIMAPCKDPNAVKYVDSFALPSKVEDILSNKTNNSISRTRPSRSVGGFYGIPNLSSNQNILYKILSKPANDTVMIDKEGTCNSSHRPKNDFLAPDDYRERSQSMGSTASPYSPSTNGGLSRNSSQDSLASIDSESSSHQLLEYTRTRLGRLLMAGSGEADSAALAGYQGSIKHSHSSLSQPATPPNAAAQVSFGLRKHSEGSQRAYLKHKFMMYRQQQNAGLPSLQARRRKPYSRPADVARGEELMDEGFEGSISGEVSLLKDILRGRSNSLSVYETNHVYGAGAMGFCRQRVTLAKKNLLPVRARVYDRLDAIVKFAASLPEFTRMPVEEQTRLLVGACPRLLLLYLAEMNLQFAVTPVPDGGGHGGTGCGEDGAGPTLQFVDAIQSFIKKCQKNGVTTNEYFYMRMIALFHSGCVRELSDAWSRVAESTHLEARQDLQELVQHTRPDDKQRYTSLLFVLLTLYSINAQMIHALFCTPVFNALDLDDGKSNNGNSQPITANNLENFIRERLCAAQSGGVNKCMAGQGGVVNNSDQRLAADLSNQNDCLEDYDSTSS